MMDEHALRWLLLGAIGSVGLIFAAVFVAGLRRRASEQSGLRIQPSGAELATGFVTVFFDTLGIGSFATTTAIFRAMRLVPDELIPGTLNVGHTIESVLSAFVFINLVPVAPVTLISMVVASALGAWFGSGVVAQLPRQRIRYGMGVALTVDGARAVLTGARRANRPEGDPATYAASVTGDALSDIFRSAVSPAACTLALVAASLVLLARTIF